MVAQTIRDSSIRGTAGRRTHFRWRLADLAACGKLYLDGSTLFYSLACFLRLGGLLFRKQKFWTGEEEGLLVSQGNHRWRTMGECLLSFRPKWVRACRGTGVFLVCIELGLLWTSYSCSAKGLEDHMCNGSCTS